MGAGEKSKPQRPSWEKNKKKKKGKTGGGGKTVRRRPGKKGKDSKEKKEKEPEEQEEMVEEKRGDVIHQYTSTTRSMSLKKFATGGLLLYRNTNNCRKCIRGGGGGEGEWGRGGGGGRWERGGR